MSKFDTSGWGEFKIGDLFEIIKTNKVTKNKDGDLPATTATLNNNQIGKYISRQNATILKQCFSATANGTGMVFYQPYEFTILQDSYAFKFKDENIHTAEIHFFIVAILNKIYSKYDWNNKSGWNKIKNEIITLPINQNGEIDFDFMETTIKNTKFKMQNILNTYKSLIQRERESKIWNLDFSPNHTLSEKERSFIDGGIMQIAVHLAKSINCEWREFSLSDLFDIVLAKGDLQPKKLEKGNIPLVSAGNFNNGIAMYIDGGDGISEKFEKNCITIDMFGKAFYQNSDFYAVSHGRVNMLLPKFKLNKFIGLFFSSVLTQKLFGKYSFSVMCSQSKLTKEKISLPTDKFGNPNFEIMENFIKEIEQNHTAKLLAYYRHITAMGGGISKFEISDYLKFDLNSGDKKILWREFLFKDLFENIKQGARLKSADHIKGNLPFVMAGTINAGISGYIGNENVRKFNANAITIDIFGNTFYRNYEFGASDDVGVFWNNTKQINQNAMIFIASVISKQLQGKFDFGNKLRASQTYDFKISLPTYENGEIAFEFMEKYILNLKNQSAKFITMSK